MFSIFNEDFYKKNKKGSCQRYKSWRKSVESEGIHKFNVVAMSDYTSELLLVPYFRIYHQHHSLVAMSRFKSNLKNKFFKLCEKLLPFFSEVKRSPSGRAMKKKFGSNLRTNHV